MQLPHCSVCALPRTGGSLRRVGALCLEASAPLSISPALTSAILGSGISITAHCQPKRRTYTRFITVVSVQ
jgi:hypothetical protein